MSVRFASFEDVLGDDLEAFALLTGPVSSFGKGEHLRLEGTADPEIYRLRSGWLASSLTTHEGGRQITKINLPGDLVGMPSFAGHEAAETIEALTDVEVETIPPEAFTTIFRSHRRFAAMLFMWAQEERVHLMHQLSALGRMKGPRRLAVLLLGLYQRALLNDPALGPSLLVPLTQQDLGDATGMSVVHANRSLKELRDWGMVSIQPGGMVTFHDLPRLIAYADVPAMTRRRTDWI